MSLLVLARYAFRSEEKVALQEIGPRFTLKLRSLRKGLPAVQNFGEAPKKVEIQVGVDEEDEVRAKEGIDGLESGGLEKDREAGEDEETRAEEDCSEETSKKKVVKPPKQDEFLWVWKVCRFLLDSRGYEYDGIWYFISPSWRRRGGRSFCRYSICI
jgi:ribosome production factor 1